MFLAINRLVFSFKKHNRLDRLVLEITKGLKQNHSTTWETNQGYSWKRSSRSHAMHRNKMKEINKFLKVAFGWIIIIIFSLRLIINPHFLGCTNLVAIL